MLNKILQFTCPLIVFLALDARAASDDTGRVKETFPKVRRAETVEEQKISVGVTAGMASTEGRSNALGYGVEAAYQPFIPFSVGIDLGGYSSPSSGANATLTRTRLLARGQYNFGGTIPFVRHSWVGLGAGAVMDNEPGSTSTNFGIQPIVGFDLPIDDDAKFSLGANANYLFVGGAKPDVFALNGVAKYWF